jgi:hypothetical protein
LISSSAEIPASMSEASDAADDMEPHIAAAGADADERSPGTDLTLPEPSDERLSRNKIPATRAFSWKLTRRARARRQIYFIRPRATHARTMNAAAEGEHVFGTAMTTDENALLGADARGAENSDEGEEQKLQVCSARAKRASSRDSSGAGGNKLYWYWARHSNAWRFNANHAAARAS